MKTTWRPGGLKQIHGQASGDYASEAALMVPRMFGVTSTVAAGTARELGKTEWLMQAGTEAATLANASYPTITFPHAFPLALLCVTFSIEHFSEDTWILDGSMAVTGFQMGHDYAGAAISRNICWIAIGC